MGVTISNRFGEFPTSQRTGLPKVAGLERLSPFIPFSTFQNPAIATPDCSMEPSPTLTQILSLVTRRDSGRCCPGMAARWRPRSTVPESLTWSRFPRGWTTRTTARWPRPGWRRPAGEAGGCTSTTSVQRIIMWTVLKNFWITTTVAMAIAILGRRTRKGSFVSMGWMRIQRIISVATVAVLLLSMIQIPTVSRG